MSSAGMTKDLDVSPTAEAETCATCGGTGASDWTPQHRIEGGSLSCQFCDRTFTFNFMRDRGPFRCSCARAVEAALCPDCDGTGKARPEASS